MFNSWTPSKLFDELYLKTNFDLSDDFAEKKKEEKKEKAN